MVRSPVGWRGDAVDGCSAGVSAILLALLFITVVGPGTFTSILAIAFVYTPIFTRVVRGPALSIRARDFVDAARTFGSSTSYILTRHLMLNLVAPLTVQVTLALAWSLLTESGLSFLGLGTQPPNSSLGLMLADSINLMEMAPWLLIFPGLTVMLGIPRLQPVGRCAARSSGSTYAQGRGMTQLLSVQNLSVGFGKGNTVKPIIRDASFTLDAGETLAIVGESGSGKSVTALSINRLIDYGGGRILNGRIDFAASNGRTADLATLAEHELERVRGSEIGMIFQEPMTSLNPVVTIGKQIEEVFRLQGKSGSESRAETLRALDRVRIADASRRLGYYPHQLSGGMLQRVMIAMALAASPRLLIADEPTTALDVSVQAQIMALLSELQRETGTGLIFITHDLGLVAGIADRVMVMQAGQVVEQGRRTRSSIMLSTPTRSIS